MTIATVNMVAVRLGRPITQTHEVDQVQAWLSDVELQIRGRVADLDNRAAAGTTYREIVASVEAAVVTRMAQNPEGVRSLMRTVDDGTIQKTIDSVRSSGLLTLTDHEWSLLLPIAANEAFSTRIRYQPGWH